MTRKRWIIALGAVLAAIAVGAVIAVASGGGNDVEVGDAPSGFGQDVPSGGAPPGFGEVSQEFQDCLEKQGVEIDPGSGPPQGQPDSDMAEAMQACQQYLPDAPSGGDFPAPPSG